MSDQPENTAAKAENIAEEIITPAAPRSMSARLRAYFLTGIFVTAPVAITLYLAYLFFTDVFHSH